jgi:RNA polymerase sigma-70 factor (ECF subfamily)
MTGDLPEAQDLSQEVFLRAYHHLGGLRDPGGFAGWVVGITRVVCKQWRRDRFRDRHRYVGLNPVQEGEGDSPCEQANPEIETQALRKAMRSLPQKERLALYTFYLQGRSAEQARALLGMSRSGMYRVLQRARKRLARMLRKHREDVL